MKVFVIFDPLLERVVCVHEEEDMDCPKCLRVKEDRKDNGTQFYYLEEHEHEVAPGKRTERDNKLNNIGI